MQNKHQPRKRFGQNFLTDQHVLQRIIAAINPQPGEYFVEIGPGQGALTQYLLDKRVDLHAIEIDRDLITILQEKFTDETRFHLHNTDALKFDYNTLGLASFRLVGNLPYNISTPLMFHLFEYGQLITDMCFMLQKEVVDRMTADTGSKAYGRLSVMTQYYCQAQKLFIVPPGAFFPPPKVDSAIVQLIPKNTSEEGASNPAHFAELVKRAFAQRRKTIRNNLKNFLELEKLAECDIAESDRAENISLQQYIALSNACQ